MQHFFQKNYINTLFFSIFCALNFNVLASTSSSSDSVLSDYHYILGEIASLEKKRDESLFYFNQVLSYDKKNSYVLFRRAKEFFYQGLVNPARIECERLVADSNKSFYQTIDIHLFLAQIYQAMNWPEKASNQYRQVLQMQPRHPEALLQYALLSIEKGEKPSKKALQDLNHSPRFHHYKGDIYLFQGDEKKAIASFKKALLLDSSYRMAALRLFQIYEYKDQIHRLINFMEKSSFQDTYILSLVAQAYLKKGDQSKMLWQISDLLWDHPLIQNFKKEWLLQKI